MTDDSIEFARAHEKRHALQSGHLRDHATKSSSLVPLFNTLRGPLGNARRAEILMHHYEGGCHCGRVRFRVASDSLEAIDCNCSICAKKGFIHLIVPKEQFTLLQGAEALTTYRFNTRIAAHSFCNVCGIHAFYVPRSHPDGIDVNVRCLDDDAIARFTIVPFDGRNWEANVDTIR